MAAYKKHQLLISKAKLHCLSIIISHASHFLTSRVQPTRLRVSYIREGWSIGNVQSWVSRIESSASGLYTQTQICGASCSTIYIVSLSEGVFWRKVNYKQGLFPFNMPKRDNVFLAECLYSYRGDLPKRFSKTTAEVWEKYSSSWHAFFKTDFLRAPLWRTFNRVDHLYISFLLHIKTRINVWH